MHQEIKHSYLLALLCKLKVTVVVTRSTVSISSLKTVLTTEPCELHIILLMTQLFSLSQQLHRQNLFLSVLKLCYAWLLTAKQQIQPQTCWCLGKCTMQNTIVYNLSIIFVPSGCDCSHMPSRQVMDCMMNHIQIFCNLSTRDQLL